MAPARPRGSNCRSARRPLVPARRITLGPRRHNSRPDSLSIPPRDGRLRLPLPGQHARHRPSLALGWIPPRNWRGAPQQAMHHDHRGSTTAAAERGRATVGGSSGPSCRRHAIRPGMGRAIHRQRLSPSPVNRSRRPVDRGLQLDHAVQCAHVSCLLDPLACLPRVCLADPAELPVLARQRHPPGPASSPAAPSRPSPTIRPDGRVGRDPRAAKRPAGSVSWRGTR